MITKNMKQANIPFHCYSNKVHYFIGQFSCQVVWSLQLSNNTHWLRYLPVSMLTIYLTKSWIVVVYCCGCQHEQSLPGKFCVFYILLHKTYTLRVACWNCKCIHAHSWGGDSVFIHLDSCQLLFRFRKLLLD